MTKEELKRLKADIETALNSARTRDDLNQIRIKYLGKKGLISSLLKSLRDLPLPERKEVGSLLNQIKDELSASLQLKEREILLAEEDAPVDVDLTLPGRMPDLGSLHPLTLVIEEICELFERLGYASYQRVYAGFYPLR